MVDIAKNIIESNKVLKFDKFEDVSKELTLLSVSESLKLIKNNLSNLGIVHDKFTSETDIVLMLADNSCDRCLIWLFKSVKFFSK